MSRQAARFMLETILFLNAGLSKMRGIEEDSQVYTIPKTAGKTNIIKIC